MENLLIIKTKNQNKKECVDDDKDFKLDEPDDGWDEIWRLVVPENHKEIDDVITKLLVKAREEGYEEGIQKNLTGRFALGKELEWKENFSNELKRQIQMGGNETLIEAIVEMTKNFTDKAMIRIAILKIKAQTRQETLAEVKEIAEKMHKTKNTGTTSETVYGGAYNQAIEDLLNELIK